MFINLWAINTELKEIRLKYFSRAFFSFLSSFIYVHMLGWQLYLCAFNAFSHKMVHIVNVFGNYH